MAIKRLNQPLGINLPRSLSTFETWGFGLTGHVGWIGTAPVIHAALGTKAIFIWLPGVLVSVALNLQVKHLGMCWPNIAGGTPNYAARLLSKYPLLARYVAIGYFLGWVAAPAVYAIVLTDLIEASLAGSGIPCPKTLLRFGFTAIAFIMGLSGTRTLGILHLFFVIPAVVSLLAFCIQGIGWLALSPDSPGFFPTELPLPSFGEWAKWFFISTYSVYSCETASSFVADSRNPVKTTQFLKFAAWLVPVVFLGGSWVLMQLANQPVGDNLYLNLLTAAKPFWGEPASLIVTLLISCCCLLSCATTVSNTSRILYQLSLDGHLSPLFSVVSRRGVLGPALLFTFILSILCLAIGNLPQVVMVTGTGYLTSIMGLHLGLWLRRGSPEALWPRWSLGFLLVEIAVLLVGGFAWGCQELVIGLVFPLGILALDWVISHAKLAIFQPQWWIKHYYARSKAHRQDFVFLQVVVLLILICSSVSIGWIFSYSLVKSASQHSLDLLVVLLVTLSFVGVAPACWTTLPQIASINNAREEAENLFVNALDAILVVDEKGVIVKTNPAAVVLLKMSSEALVGEHLQSCCSYLVGIPEQWSSRSEQTAFSGTDKPLILEVSVSGNPNQTFQDYIIILRDVTERQQAEAALRESEKKYRSVVDNVKEVIFQMDTAGEWTFLNHAWTEITGFSVEESIGTKFLSCVCADDRQCTLDLFQLLIEGQKEYYQHEFRCLTKDGDCRWIEVYARVNLDIEGNVIGTSGTLNDVTERLKVERMKNEFISTVSHELRTPLTSILGSLGLVTNGVAGEIPPSAKALLDIAHKNSERLVRLINDILDIEKIESGKMTFNLQPLELMPLLEQAIAANQGYGEQYKVKFILENTLVGVKVNADSDCLMQVLTNLLSNAAKFSPPDDTVVISVARHNQAIQVAITDRGSGIPEEFRSRVFQKFAQADSSATRQKGGTGLGLSITKAIVEKHNGQINFVTETNVGTTFYFYLPEWYEPAMTVVDNSSVSPQVPILICEDDGDIAALLKILLERSGFQADIAYDAAQAKQLLAQNQYAAMTLDIALPDIDGISLMRELRQQDSTHHLPIVVISAKAELGRQELNGDAIAVIDWLDKPIAQTRLVAAVKQAIGQIGSKPRILHIEDNSDVRQVVGAILQNVADICYAVNLQEAKQKLEQETFDLILLDLSLPDGSGLEVLPKVNAEPGRPTPVVIFSAQEVGRETLGDVAAVLVKSRTSNQKLLETIQALTNYSSLTLVE